MNFKLFSWKNIVLAGRQFVLIISYFFLPDCLLKKSDFLGEIDDNAYDASRRLEVRTGEQFPAEKRLWHFIEALVKLF